MKMNSHDCIQCLSSASLWPMFLPQITKGMLHFPWFLRSSEVKKLALGHFFPCPEILLQMFHLPFIRRLLFPVVVKHQPKQCVGTMFPPMVLTIAVHPKLYVLIDAIWVTIWVHCYMETCFKHIPDICIEVMTISRKRLVEFSLQFL